MPVFHTRLKFKKGNIILNLRHVDAFKWSDGIWLGVIGPYNVLDLFYTYHLTNNLDFNMSILNLNNDLHKELIGGAALDVYQREPPISTALTELSSVIATPHIAATTVEAQELVGLEAATGVREYLRAGIVRNAVNYPSIEPEEFKHLRPYLVLAERMGSLLAQLSIMRLRRLIIRKTGAF